VSGEGSVGYVKSERGFSQYVIDDGNPTFVWRWDLFADMRISDNISLMSNFRMLQDEVFHIDYFALRVTDIGSTGVNAQMGLIDLPFGNLGNRRFPKENPFYDLPLMNEHLTSLCQSDYKLWVLEPQFAVTGDGVRLLDQGLYDLGVEAFGRFGMFDCAAALINGMISETGVYAPHGLNANNGFGGILRVAATPMTGLTIGVSYATGSFMEDQHNDTNSAIYREDPSEYPQHIVMGDVDFSMGYFTMYGQAGYNVWDFSNADADNRKISHSDLKAFAYSVEATYAITPRLTLAARAGGLLFNTIDDSVPTFSGLVHYSGHWDRDEFRLETALNVHLSRELLLKVVYEWNRTYDVSQDPLDDVFILQSVVSF
jgi:hypothetical protein